MELGQFLLINFIGSGLLIELSVETFLSTKDYLCLELLNLVVKREAAADALNDICSNGNLILPFLFTNGSHVCKAGLQ